MNMIVCNRSCRYQRDGYCCLEGQAAITNAAVSPCCYYEEQKTEKEDSYDSNRGDNKAL